MERTSRMDNSKYLNFIKRNGFILGIVIASILYLLPRIIFPETIEFGYDQPRLSNVVMDYIRNGSFMRLQYFSLPTAWENLSWGPSLVIFNSIFLYFSNDPIVISYFFILFNLLSIILILVIGYEFFNPSVGLVAGILLATHPWWVVFSRMIYQPTPIVTIVAVSMYFLFKTIKNSKSFYVFLLLVSWGVLLQMYLITFSFIFISFCLLAFYSKLKINYKYVALSIPVLITIYIPSFKYYIDNPQIFMKLFEFKGRYTTHFSEVFVSFIKNLSGLNFKWQLGYSYDSFINALPYYGVQSLIAAIVVSLILIFGIYLILKNRNKYEISLLCIFLSPLWAIPLVGVEFVVPRYFLYILPAFVLIFAVAINEISKYSKLVFIAPVILTIFWVTFVFKYFMFIKTYNYPNGLLSLWSDPPYYFLDKSFKWIIEDSSSKFDSFTVSSDFDYPNENRFNDAQTYYWNNILDSKYKNYESNNIGHYLMYYAPSKNIGLNSKQIGPYVIERLESDPTEFVNPKNAPRVD